MTAVDFYLHKNPPSVLSPVDEDDPAEEPARPAPATPRVVVPDLEVDRIAEMLGTAQQERTHSTALKVLKKVDNRFTH